MDSYSPAHAARGAGRSKGNRAQRRPRSLWARRSSRCGHNRRRSRGARGRAWVELDAAPIAVRRVHGNRIIARALAHLEVRSRNQARSLTIRPDLFRPHPKRLPHRRHSRSQLKRRMNTIPLSQTPRPAPPGSPNHRRFGGPRLGSQHNSGLAARARPGTRELNAAGSSSSGNSSFSRSNSGRVRGS